MVLNVFKNILLNPVVLMTTLGIIGNVIFYHQLPILIKGILEVNIIFVIYLWIFLNINDQFAVTNIF